MLKSHRYIAIEHTCFDKALGCYPSFGIRAFQVLNGRWIETACVPDVSPDIALVAMLAERCTELQLEPCHLLDVIVDTIS